jgi:hypothetical protein
MVNWAGTSNIGGYSYTCGHCGKIVGPYMGYRESAQSPQWYIYICSFCDKPTFFDEKGAQTPGVAYGNPIEHLPDDIAALYKEARNCMAVRSYTAAVLICRKLLMNIAVSQKAQENQSFMYHVDYLASQGCNRSRTRANHAAGFTSSRSVSGVGSKEGAGSPRCAASHAAVR